MLQMQSTVLADGHLELAVVDVPQAEPGADDVVIRVEAAPINPSDLGLLLGGADPTSAQALAKGTGVRLKLPPEASAMLAARMKRPTPCGNEGAGVVVAAGESEAAQALLGKTVATWRGAMYPSSSSAGGPVPGLARRHDAGGRRVLFREPADVLAWWGRCASKAHAWCPRAAASNSARCCRRSARGRDRAGQLVAARSTWACCAASVRSTCDSSLDRSSGPGRALPTRRHARVSTPRRRRSAGRYWPRWRWPGRLGGAQQLRQAVHKQVYI